MITSRSLPPLLLGALLVSQAAAQTPLFFAEGNLDQDQLGTAVASAGDVDGDGVDDLIVGVPSVTGGPAAPGYIRVVSGVDGFNIHQFTLLGSDLFGSSVAGLGDATADGFDDFAVGAPGSVATNFAGHVVLYSGLDGQPFLELQARGALGFAIAPAGDVDGDGIQELATAAPDFDGSSPGVVFVSNPDPTESMSLVHIFGGLANGDQFGYAVACAGDVDGDGVPDLVVGAGATPYARVFSGDSGELLHHFTGPGPSFGQSVSGAGDLDGDGHDDIAVGAPELNFVDLYSGQTGQLIRRFDALGGDFGRSIAPLGDVTGDAVPDLLIGAPLTDVLDVTEAGVALVLSGSTGGQFFKAYGTQTGGHVGAAVAALGDSTGDGLAELAIGAPGHHDGSGDTVGIAKVHSSELLGALLPYGFGCPNSFLITPVLELLGDPVPSGRLILSVTRGFPAPSAVVFIGGGPGLAPLANGCILWVAPLLPATLVLPLAGEFPGSGDVTVIGHVPPAMPSGTVLTFQGFTPDPDASGGFATTGAVKLTVQ